MKKEIGFFTQLGFPFYELPKPKKPTLDALPHFDAPENDNQRLLNLQYDFIAGDKAALSRMYALGFTVALKFINAFALKNKHVRALDKEAREEKAHNAITYLIEQYITRADFARDKCITSYIFVRVEHELFYVRKVDKIVDFVDWETYRGASKN